MIRFKLFFIFLFSFYYYETKSQTYIQDQYFGNNGIKNIASVNLKRAELDSLGNYFICGDIHISSTIQYFIGKLTPNGNFDSSFANNGIFSFDMGYNSQIIRDLAIQSDGKIVFVGEFLNSNSDEDAIVGRVTSAGVLDSSFGGIGYTTFNGNNLNDNWGCVAIQNDGKIITGGFSAYGGLYDYKFATARYLPNGMIDSSFATNGLYRHSKDGGPDEIIPLNNGDILYGGSIAEDYFVTKLDSTGSLVSSYANNGELQYDINGNLNAFSDLIPDGSGGYYLTGLTYTGSPAYYDAVSHVFRVTSGGNVDSTMFNNGLLTISKTGYQVLSTGGINFNNNNNTLILGGTIYKTGAIEGDAIFMEVNLISQSLNTSLGNNGIYTYPDSSNNEEFNQIIQPGINKFVFFGNDSTLRGLATKYKTGITNQSNNHSSQSLNIYPNPTKDQFQLSSSAPLEKIKIYNINGNLIQEKKITGTKRHLSLDIDNAGLFILEGIFKSGKVIRGKVIVHK